ncbi:hypothetical protein ACN42_g11379, partial [Penicillium freii]
SWLECDANNVKVEGSTPSGTSVLLFLVNVFHMPPQNTIVNAINYNLISQQR